MLNPNLIILAAELSEREKRLLIILAVILAFILIITGLIVNAIIKWMNNQAKVIDLYLTDMCKYGILKTPEEVKKYTYKRELTSAFIKIRFPMYIAILAFIGYIIYINCTGYNLSQTWEAIYALRLDLNWPTEKFFGLTLISDLPTCTHYPLQGVELSLFHYITYALMLVVIFFVVNTIIQSLAYIGKQSRCRKICVDVFGKTVDLDKKNKSSLD